MLAVCRTGDFEFVHCSIPIRATGNPNVMVSGLPWSCTGDLNIPHLRPGTPCKVHVAPIYSGSANVYVGGSSAGRVSSPTCTMVATGSTNVFCI